MTLRLQAVLRELPGPTTALKIHDLLRAGGERVGLTTA